MKNTNIELLSHFLFLSFFFFPSCQTFQPGESTNRLHDIWGLKEINGQKIDVVTQGAVLELYVSEQRFLLSVNKRSYQGKFQAGASRIAFSKIKPVLESNYSATEKELIATLKKADRWTFEKRFLFLYAQDKVIARFVKMD